MTVSVQNNWCVYIHTFPNGKRYVGVARRYPKKRWGPDGIKYNRQPIIWNAIQKYGWENIKHDVVKTGLSEHEAALWEERLIKDFKTFTPNHEYGYNGTSGGEVRQHSEETLKKISKKSRQYWSNPEARLKVSKRMKGRIVSEEQRHKMSELQKDGKSWMCGKHPSEETRKKLSAVHKGCIPWNTGLKMPDDYCKKLSQMRKGRKRTEHANLLTAQKCRKSVRCIETGMVYIGQREASKALNINEGSLSEAIKGTRQTAGGYHWERVC